MRRYVGLWVGVAFLLALPGSGFGTTFTVGATDNIFLAGQLMPLVVAMDQTAALESVGDGSLPVGLSVTGGTTIGFSDLVISSLPSVLTCNVAHLFLSNYQATSPDGGTCGAINSTNISSYGGISGIKSPGVMFLTGVFLGGTIPGVAPPSLDFTTLGTSFSELSPTLGQTFFIGDGRTGRGVGDMQHFIVPTGATMLYLGFVDGNGGTPFAGSNSHYTDNFGSINGTMSVVVPTPEPATMALLGFGLAGLGLLRRRK